METETKTSQNRWLAGRVFHLRGGLRAVNWFAPTTKIAPKTLEAKVARFDSTSYTATLSELESLGLRTIGVEYYSHQNELNGGMPPNWRPYHFGSGGWLCDDGAQTWSQIAHAAYKSKRARLWDSASRISHQLRVCGWRLREVSEAYRDELHAQVQDKFVAGQRFKSQFTWLTYLAVQSFLVDVCVLRDYLAEFASYFIYVTKDGEPIARVTRMANLQKQVLNRSIFTDRLSGSLRDAVGVGGWLKELGAYRDLIIHSAPLALATEGLFAIQDIFVLDLSHQLPCIVCPLPDKPEDIHAERARGSAFDNFEQQIQTFLQAMQDGSPHKDALTYAHSALRNICELAQLVADKSPVVPEPIVIHESDMIGGLRINDEELSDLTLSPPIPAHFESASPSHSRRRL